MSVDLPAIGTIPAAEEGAPYLAVALTLEPARRRAAGRHPPIPAPARQEGFSVAAVTPELLDAWARLLRLMDRPEDIPALAPAYEREILYRVLTGPLVPMMRHIATPDTMLHRVHQVIRWLRANHAAGDDRDAGEPGGDVGVGLSPALQDRHLAQPAAIPKAVAAVAGADPAADRRGHGNGRRLHRGL